MKALDERYCIKRIGHTSTRSTGRWWLLGWSEELKSCEYGRGEEHNRRHQDGGDISHKIKPGKRDAEYVADVAGGRGSADDARVLPQPRGMTQQEEERDEAGPYQQALG